MGNEVTDICISKVVFVHLYPSLLIKNHGMKLISHIFILAAPNPSRRQVDMLPCDWMSICRNFCSLKFVSKGQCVGCEYTRTADISVSFYLDVQCTTLTVCFLLRTGRQAVCVDRKVVPRSREQGGPFRHDVRALVRTLSTTQTGLGKGKQIKYIVFNPRLKPRILYLLDLNQGQIK